MRIDKKSHKKVIIISVIAALILAAAGFAGYYYLYRNDTKHSTTGVSLERTPEDKKLEQNLKDNPQQKQQATQTDQPSAPPVDKTTNLQQVNVVLTNTGETNGMVSASGFVSNVVESNGSCSYVFTNGPSSVTKTSTTLTNANSTTCKTVQFNASELGAGTWNVQLKYSSPTSTGSSNTLQVAVS